MELVRILLLLIFCQISKLRSDYCYTSKSCQNIEFTDEWVVNCMGFQSCKGAYNVDIGSYFTCFGSQSCIDLNPALQEPGFARCYGLQSCFGNIIHPSWYLYCYGEQSCMNSTIIFDKHLKYSRGIMCYGLNSCSYSTFTIIDPLPFNNDSINNGQSSPLKLSMYVGGASGLHNSIINVINTTFNLYLYGYQSGDNLTIHCGYNNNNNNNNFPCVINCAANGCKNTIIYCYNTPNATDLTGAKICDINCDESSGINIDCPTVYYINNNDTNSIDDNSNNIDRYDIKRDDWYNMNTILDDTISVCDVLCIDYRDKNCNDTKKLFNQGSVCCEAQYGCDLGLLIPSVNVNKDSKGNNSSLIVRCDGYQSCHNVINIASTASINSNINTTIYCTSYYSCQKVTIYLANNTDIDGNNSNINGINSGSGDSESKNVKDNNVAVLQCNGYESCDAASILLFEQDADIYCVGYRACQHATIERANDSNSNSSINVNIFAFGQESVYVSRIETDGKGIVINLYFCGGYSAKFVTINCKENDICNIYCISNDACQDMRSLKCDGICTFIYNNASIVLDVCNDKAFWIDSSSSSAPTTVNSITSTSTSTTQSIDTTQSPTHVPTVLPSVVSTVMPTTSPTATPSTTTTQITRTRQTAETSTTTEIPWTRSTLMMSESTQLQSQLLTTSIDIGTLTWEDMTSTSALYDYYSSTLMALVSKQAEKNDTKWWQNIWVLISMIVGLILVFLLIVVLCLKKRKHTRHYQTVNDSESGMLTNSVNMEMGTVNN